MTDLDEVLRRLNDLFAKVDRRPYYTLTDLARLLRVDRERIREWIDTGELEGYNVGTKENPVWRVSPAALERWQMSRRAVPQQPARKKPKVFTDYLS